MELHKDAKTQGDKSPPHLHALCQPLSQKSWTLEGHLRAKIPCPVSLLLPWNFHSHTSAQGRWVACKRPAFRPEQCGRARPRAGCGPLVSRPWQEVAGTIQKV